MSAEEAAWEEYKNAGPDDEAWAQLIKEIEWEPEDDFAPGCADGLHKLQEIRIHIDMCEKCGDWWHRTDG